MTTLLVLAIGLLLGWTLARVRSRRSTTPMGLQSAQLMRWIDAAPSGWLLLDCDDAVHLINRRAERLLECPAASSPRPQPLELICSAHELRDVVHNARHRERPQRLEWKVKDEELVLHALPASQGWVALVLLNRRSLEAQLDHQERWVSDVAHELRTPLTALLLVGESLAAQVNSRNVVLVERLQRELRRLQELVGDLLELSRLENTLPGEGGWQGRVDLPQLVDRVWADLAPLAAERGVVLRQDVESPAEVIGDPSRLHRALLNLLDNAVRFSPEGGQVRVNVQVNGQWCQLTVRDQGPGLSQEDLDHMFERFYRGDPSRVRGRRGGSGLGLSIVQQIAVTHGGRVQASNHAEGGTMIELLLPVGRGAAGLPRPSV